MLISDQRLQSDTQTTSATTSSTPCAELTDLLEHSFGTPLAIVDGASGEVLYQPAGQPMVDGALGAQLCREVARRARPEFLDDDEPLLVLALPLEVEGGQWASAQERCPMSLPSSASRRSNWRLTSRRANATLIVAKPS